MLTKVVQNFEEHQQAGLLVPIKQVFAIYHALSPSSQ
jgi:hypothetical protein